MNVFFGFPWADVPDAGMTIQAFANGDRALSERAARDMAAYAWRHRDALVASAKVLSISDGVRQARDAVAAGAVPVVLADHSDRSGHATWLLREILEQGLSRGLVATVADAEVVADCLARRLGAGDPFDAEVGGRVDPSAGEPVRIVGTVLSVPAAGGPRIAGAGGGGGGRWICVGFGAGNVLVLTPQLVQVIEPVDLWDLGLKAVDFDVVAIKSRVHFRRGFDDGGYARTILLVEPPEPFLGTVRLEGLAYENLRLEDFHPYGDPPAPV